MNEEVSQFEYGTTPGEGTSLRLLIFGCGNVLAGDDGAGREIVRRLREKGDCGVELQESSQAGVDLLQSFDRADIILFVDAVSSGAPPGTLHLVPPPWTGLKPRGLRWLSSHGWGLTETLAMARALGRRVPRMLLLGVEIETVSPNAQRSAAVEEAIELVVGKVPSLISMVVNCDSALWHSPLHLFPNKGPQEGRSRWPFALS